MRNGERILIRYALIICLVSLSLVVAGRAQAQQTWYIHATEGSDLNTGRSPSSPFKTLARFRAAFENAETLPGAELALSGTFREDMLLNFQDRAQGLTIRRWNASENPEDYPLQSPVIRGDKLLPGPFTRAGTSNMYVTEVPPGLAIEGVVWNWDSNVDLNGRHAGHLVPAASPAACANTPLSWYYTGTLLSINLTPTSQALVDPGTGVLAYVASGPNAGICLQNAQGCTINGIAAYLWLRAVDGAYGFSMEHATNSSFVNCSTIDTSHHGIGFTGTTGSGNTIDSCEVRGLMGLNGTPYADCFGFLSSGTEISNGLVTDCTAYCYGILTPDRKQLRPERSVSAFLCGTTYTPNVYVRGLLVERLNVYIFPEGGRYAVPCRYADILPPTDVNDPATYSLRFESMNVFNGAAHILSGLNSHAAYVDCTFDLSRASALGFYNSGAITCQVASGPVNHTLFKRCTIDTNVDHPNGLFWNSIVVGVAGGNDLRFIETSINEIGLRLRGSTANMFYYLDGGGKVFARDSKFTYANTRGVRRLCANDPFVQPPNRDFDACRYTNVSSANYTQWYGPSFGYPGDIRSATGWLLFDAGDNHGTITNTAATTVFNLFQNPNGSGPGDSGDDSPK